MDFSILNIIVRILSRMMTSFLREKHGSITVATAMVLTTLVASVCFGMEFARVTEIRKNIQGAADAAVLVTTKRHVGTGESAEASRLAEETFRMNLRDDRTVTIDDFTFRSSDADHGTITVEASVETIVGPVLLSRLGITASATVSEEYLDVYLLVDRSDSMLLAEEGPDMDDMMALSKPMLLTDVHERHYSEPEGCAFACHRTEGWETDGKSLYVHAVENGITLRAQRMTNAMRDVIAGTFMDNNETIRVGIVDFAMVTELVLEPTRDLPTLETALARADDRLGPVTHYPELVDFILASMGESGTGRAENDARRVLVMATDGAHSWWAADGSDHYDPIDPATCLPLKEAGYTLAILNTRYDPLDYSHRYEKYAAPNADLYGPALRACASEGLYFEVGSGEDIVAEFRKISAAIAPGPIVRLTQ